MILDNEHCPLPRYTIVEVWIRDEDYLQIQKRAAKELKTMITALEDAVHDWCELQRAIDAVEPLSMHASTELTVPHPDVIDIRDLDSAKITDIKVTDD